MKCSPPTCALLLLLALGPAPGCASDQPGPRGWDDPEEFDSQNPRNPAEVFAHLEELLLETRSVIIKATITAEGAVQAALSGQWIIERGNRVRIDVSGTFVGRPVKLQLVSDGQIMRGGSEQVASFEEPTAPALNEALILGFTRMGLLHNLAMLSQGEVPDRADGSVRGWVQAADITGDVQNTGDNRVRVLRYDLFVDGVSTADVQLFVHPESTRPLRRRQTVRFGDEEMRVIERYEVVRLGTSIPASRFALETEVVPEVVPDPAPDAEADDR